MTDRDAYEEEMARFLGLSEKEVESLIEGVPPDESLDEIATFFVAAGRLRPRELGNATARRHLSAMSEEIDRLATATEAVAAKDASSTEPSRRRRVVDKTVSVLAKATAGVLTASLSMVGLAYAGVDLPGTAAEKALEKVTGLELPNQGPEADNGKSVADDVKAVVGSVTEKGCEFGQAVATAASQNREGDGGSDTDPCTNENSESVDQEPQGSKATGEERSKKGRANASEKSDDASSLGADNAGTHDDKGRATAEEASTEGQEKRSSKAEAGADNAGTNDDKGKATSEDASDSGKKNGAGNAEEGQSNNPTDNGPP